MNRRWQLLLVAATTIVAAQGGGPRCACAQLGLGFGVSSDSATGTFGGDPFESYSSSSLVEVVQPKAPPDVNGQARRAAARVDRAAAVEERLVAAVNQAVAVDFAGTPLADVVALLGTKCHVPLCLDPKGLADAAVDASAPITFSAQGVSLRAALDAMLEEFDLTWVIHDETIKITSKEKADEMLTTKVYPVGDLLGLRPLGKQVAGRHIGGSYQQWGPLMMMITTIIQPDSWDDNGGPGSISPFAQGNVLVISQKRTVHEEIEELFVMLRREVHDASYPYSSSSAVVSRPQRASIAVAGSRSSRAGGFAAANAAPANQTGVAYTTNQQGLQMVSGLYGGSCRIRAGTMGAETAQVQR